VSEDGEYKYAEHSDSGELHDDRRSRVGRTKIVIEDGEQGSESSGDVPANSAPVKPDYKIERVTSSILGILCFVLNWYSAYNGHPQYIPDWLLGIMLGGYGAPLYQWMKGKVRTP
jgi:hypothetical protein